MTLDFWDLGQIGPEKLKNLLADRHGCRKGHHLGEGVYNLLIH